jgi:hypothetical protein
MTNFSKKCMDRRADSTKMKKSGRPDVDASNRPGTAQLSRSRTMPKQIVFNCVPESINPPLGGLSASRPNSRRGRTNTLFGAYGRGSQGGGL